MSLSVRTLGIVARQETRMLLADQSLALVVGLLTLLLAYGFYNGLDQTQARTEMVATVQQAEADRVSSLVDRLRRIEVGEEQPGPFDNPANPATLGNGAGRQAVLHDAALAPIAIGQSDMMPNYYRIGTRSKVEFMYDSEIESPWNLLSGHFDLAFVVVFLLPLMIFALTFNLLSAERESGTERMLLSQPLGLTTLALGKLLPRAAAVLGVAGLLPVALLLAFHPEARGGQVGPLLGWIGIVMGYGGFWFAVALAVNSLRLSSSANALILIASWTILVLVVPLLLNLLVERLHPSPSRVELSIQTRAIQAENLRRYDDQFSGDFRYIEEPEALQAKDGRIEIPPRTMASFLARRDMDARVDALLDDFDESLVEQQAAVDRLSFLSPAILTYEGLTTLAGTDGQRYLAYRQEVSAFHDRWRKHFEPFILNGIAMDEGHLRQLPQWHTPAELRPTAPLLETWRILLLALVASAIAAAGLFNLKQYKIA
jgi:ABC-2 type transport system permease protein